MTTLKQGSKGEEVKDLQRALNLYVDGKFGPLTDEAVRAFQREHNLDVDGIVGPKTWAAINAQNINNVVDNAKSDALNVKKSKRSINLIVVHCTATVEGKDYSVAEIRKWHLKRGFSDIGYHYLIGINGKIHEGRNVNISGAHTAGYNAHSIGVCYVGGLDKNHNAKDTRTQAQKDSLLRLLKKLKELYPKATIHGHREYANKACPCFDAKNEYKSI